MKIKLVRNKDKQWYFKIVASNGKTLCHSETYSKKSSALRAIILIKNSALLAPVEEVIETCEAERDWIGGLDYYVLDKEAPSTVYRRLPTGSVQFRLLDRWQESTWFNGVAALHKISERKAYQIFLKVINPSES